MLLLVCGHQRKADEHVLLRNGRGDDRGDEDSLLVGESNDLKGLVGVAHHQRDNRGFGGVDVEPVLAESLPGVAGDVPQVLQALRLAFHNVESLGCSCN